MARWCRNNFAPKQKKGERVGRMRISPIENSGFLHWSWEDCTLSLFSDARTVVEFIRVLVEVVAKRHQN